jgi:capsule polysaccharide modification protein KpsS
VSYRRPELVEDKDIFDDDKDLPKHITDRLAQIRALALEKYREVHG